MHLASSQMDCAHLERWCAWFRAQRALLQKWGAAAVTLDTVDLSCNEIGDRWLAVLVDLLVELSPKVLRLFRNRISDASPVERLLAKGCLRELHLSNNNVPVAVATQLVVAAACAVDENGASRYPIGDVEPLWLRLENNFESQPTDSFARRLLPELCKAERSQAVCFVDGRTGCNPKRCACVGGARAVHLLHVGSSCLNSRRAVQQLASQHTGHENQPRGSPTQHHGAWRNAVLPEEKSPPAVAPWRRAGTVLPPQPSLYDLSEFPPLPGQAQDQRQAADDRCASDVGCGEGLSAQSPCYILARGESCDGALSCMTLGVCTQDSADTSRWYSLWGTGALAQRHDMAGVLGAPPRIAGARAD